MNSTIAAQMKLPTAHSFQTNELLDFDYNKNIMPNQAQLQEMESAEEVSEMETVQQNAQSQSVSVKQERIAKFAVITETDVATFGAIVGKENLIRDEFEV